MMSNMDRVFKKVLNDKDIFNNKYGIPELFEKEEWKELKQIFEKGEKDNFNKKVEYKIQEIEKKVDKKYKEQIDELKKRAKWLKDAFENKKNLLQNLLDTLEWYGLVECKLPAMNDCGIVIERYDKSLVKQYFFDKMKKERNSIKKKALEKVLNYVMELYDSGVSSEEIAYFIRKIKSLELYWGVIE